MVDSFMYQGKLVTSILDNTKIVYIDPFHDNTQPFFEATLPDFFNLVGGFDGLHL